MKTTKQIRRRAKRLFRLCLIDGVLAESRVAQAAQRIFQSKHRGSQALLSDLLRLVRLDRSRHSAEIDSATPLPDDLLGSVSSNLERVYGPGIKISFAQHPELIGGMRIKVGSDVYDGSVKAGLAALESRF